MSGDPFHLLKAKYSGGRALVPLAKVLIGGAFDAATQQPTATVEFNGLWDTGASGTAITKKVVDALGLPPLTATKVYHAQGESLANVYSVSLGFPGIDLRFPSMKVNESILNGIDVLIGMDVISQGDFIITNEGGVTELNFHYPSVGIDRFARRIKKFVVPPAPKPASPVPAVPMVGRNDPCPCGSGKKFKVCCIPV